MTTHTTSCVTKQCCTVIKCYTTSPNADLAPNHFVQCVKNNSWKWITKLGCRIAFVWSGFTRTLITSSYAKLVFRPACCIQMKSQKKMSTSKIVGHEQNSNLHIFWLADFRQPLYNIKEGQIQSHTSSSFTKFTKC